MRCSVRASSNFVWMIKTYIHHIYIYIRGVDIFIHRTDKNINHLLTDKIFCPQKQIKYAPDYNLVANKNFS
jgi:hypothetical protein